MPRNKHKKANEKVLEVLGKTLKGNEILIIGVSGGPDSVFLLNCLLEFKEQTAPKTTSLKIIVAHVNHILRGHEAEEDLEFVKSLAKKHNLEFEKTEVDINSLAETTKSSIEESGREIRYKFFLKLFKKYKADFLATAHHSDDSLETILLNFIRGASLKGLCGIKLISTQKTGLTLFRPLLCVSKQEIIEYLQDKNIKFRIDQTNFDTKIPRNFLRHEIIPQLKTLNPNLSQTILKNSESFMEIQNFLNEKAKVWIQENSNINNARSQSSFDLKSFNLLPRSLQKEIIILIYKNKAGTTKDIENTHLNEVLSIINKNIGGKKKRLGKYTVEIKQGTFIFNTDCLAKNSRSGHITNS